MPYRDATLKLVRQVLKRPKSFVEKRMFGGVGFLLNGNMCCGVWKEFLILRVGPDAYDALLAEPHIREFDVTGRPMRGWIMVEPEAYEDAAVLGGLIATTLEFVRSLPPKE